jgi:hypothetical protein
MKMKMFKILSAAFVFGAALASTIQVKAQTNAPRNSTGTVSNTMKSSPSGIFTDIGTGTVSSISPNGKYAAGISINEGYVYDLQKAQTKIIKGATDARDVNDKGHAVVIFYDSSYMRIATGNTVPTPIINGGVYRDDTIYSLGLGRKAVIPKDAVPPIDILAIDSSSSAYGATFLYNSSAKIAPFAFRYNGNDYITDTMPFACAASADDQGGKILSVSQDGKVAGGWIALKKYRGRRMAALWTRPDTTVMLDEDTPADGGGKVSPNGKYFATTYQGRAALYDIEKNKLTVFGSENSVASSVSDNGFVIGFEEIPDGGRLAFIWSDKLGFMYLRDFIDKYLPDMQIPQDDGYFTFSASVATTPMDISQDGLTIVGFSAFNNLERKGWIIQIAEPLNLIDRPQKATATVDIPKRNIVNIKWDAPADYGTNTLTSYYIYRNGIYINKVDAAADLTVYTDSNAPDGPVSYQISAVYNNNSLESSKTDPAEVTIIDNYNLPFADDFEHLSLAKNYWTVERSIKGSWIPVDVGMTVNGKAGIYYYVLGNGEAYNVSLTSKPFDATSKNKVILSFTHAIVPVFEDVEFFGRRDTIAIEINEIGSNQWTMIKPIQLEGKLDWENVTIDISEAAANKLFRLRFRAAAASNFNNLTYKLDNVGIHSQSPEMPVDVIAYRAAKNAPVNVMYKDAAGSYGLSYSTGATAATAIGTGEKSIIAVNSFNFNELAKMQGKYLTSISAYLLADYVTSLPTEIKLAVFVNDKRIESSTVSEWKGNAWNNFPLSEPVAIGKDISELLVGIEAVCQNTINRPISMSWVEFGLDTVNKTFLFYGLNPKGNMFSEDGGQSWANAHDESSYENKIVFSGHWDIVANIRDEAAAATPDDDFSALRYEIYRNEQKLSAFNYGQYFVDTTGASDDDCYTVKVFNLPGGISPISQEGCVEIVEGASIAPLMPAEEIIVYPNPTSAIVTVVADVKATRIYDMQGKLAAHSNTSSVDMRSLPNGTYLLEITTKEGKVVTKKVIKK